MASGRRTNWWPIPKSRQQIHSASANGAATQGSFGAEGWSLPETAAGSRTALIEAAGLWTLSRYEGSRYVIDAAAHAVSHGVGGIEVVRLASLYPDADSWDLLPAVVNALSELGAIDPQTAVDELDLADAALSAMSRRFLTGLISGADLARWAYRTFGYVGLSTAGELARLDDDYVAYSDDDAPPEETERITSVVRALAERQLRKPAGASDR